MRYLRILFCSLIIISVLSCCVYATAETTNALIGNYILVSGTYRFNDVVNFRMLNRNGTTYINFPFVSNDVAYDNIRITQSNSGVLVDFYYRVDDGDGSYTQTKVYTKGATTDNWVSPEYQTIVIDDQWVIDDPAVYNFLVTNLVRTDTDYDGNIVGAIITIFTMLGSWLGTAFGSVQNIFWTVENGLTMVGTLSVMGLAFAICFLLFSLGRSFLRFK